VFFWSIHFQFLTTEAFLFFCLRDRHPHSTMAGSQQQDDGDFQCMPTRKNTTKKSLYIGNIPVDVENLEERLVELLKKSKPDIAIELQDVTVVRSKGCHAVVACSGNHLDELIRKLHQTEFEGNRIVVQRERKQKTFADASKKPVMAKSWAAGKKPVIAKSWAAPTQKVEKQEVEIPVADPPADIQEVSERIGAIVGDEMEAARKNGEDELNALIASTAAVSMLAGTEFGLQEEIDLTPQDNYDQEDTDVGGFMARCQQPMSSLMGEYGDHDPNWKQVEPEIPAEKATASSEILADTSAASVTTPTPTPEKARVLGMQGKMPVHVEFTSFGYKNGAPAQVRNGWTYSQPLPVFDCRHLPTVPPYLERQDGLSGAVKRCLMYNPHKDDPSIPSMKSFAKEVADEVAPTMIEAINEGGHGYAMPLRMVIHIGSESGRHRAVVACELAATALRKILRANKDTQFKQPCSVGTSHLKAQRRRKDKVRVGKQNALEGE
jgi:hypothetical protein